MIARVNLLPPEIETARRARRTARLSTVAVAAWIGVLGVGFMIKTDQVDAARDDRDAAQAQVDDLNREVAALDEYAKLAAALDARSAILTSAMTEEISWARVLNDLSLAFPADASLNDLNALLVAEEEPVPGEVKPAAGVGDLTFTGYSVERFAPGVEGVLLRFDDAEGFNDTFLTTAQKAEKGTTAVTDFTGTVRLDEDARTNRYANGLPEEAAQ